MASGFIPQSFLLALFFSARLVAVPALLLQVQFLKRSARCAILPASTRSCGKQALALKWPIGTSMRYNGTILLLINFVLQQVLPIHFTRQRLVKMLIIVSSATFPKQNLRRLAWLPAHAHTAFMNFLTPAAGSVNFNSILKIISVPCTYYPCFCTTG